MNTTTMVKHSARVQSVKAPLLEVANVLCTLYNDYIRDREEKNVLVGLMKLIDDLNLTEALCILEVERTRLKVMRRNGDEITMSYESFYEWLGEASGLIFLKFDESGSRALNILLTKYVIPAATREKGANLAYAAVSIRGHTALEDSTLRVLIPYTGFLNLWYICRENCDSIRMSPSYCFGLRCAYQPERTASTRASSVERIFEALKSCGIFSGDVLDDDHAFFAEMALIASSPCDSFGSGNALNSLAFPGFLGVLERVAKKVSVSHAKAMGMSLSSTVKLNILIQKLTEKLLNSTLQKFVDSEHVENAVKRRQNELNINCLSSSSMSSCADATSATTAYASHSYSHAFSLKSSAIPGPSVLSLRSVLWLARQAGITQIPNLSLYQLLDELVSRADPRQLSGAFVPGVAGEFSPTSSSSTSLKTLSWSVTELPRVLCQICEENCKGKTEVMAPGLTEISSLGRVSLLLAQYLPALFFSSPVRSPTILATLYEPYTLQQLQSISHDIDIFFRAMRTSPLDNSLSTHAALAITTLTHFSKVDLASMRDFNRICRTSGTVPHLLSTTLVKDTCENILGYSITEDSLDIQVCKNDWIEILYVLAQVCFNDGSPSVGGRLGVSETDKDEGHGTVQKLYDLLKCFTSVSYLSVAIGRSKQGSDPQAFLAESLRSRSVNPGSDSSRIKRSEFAGHSPEGAVKGSSKVMEGSHRADSLSRCVQERLERNKNKSRNSNMNGAYGMGTGSSAFPPETSRDESKGASGFSLRQVIIALAHYPCNSLDLNPWTIYRMHMGSYSVVNDAHSSSSSSSSSSSRNGSATGDATLKRMGSVFKTFCTTFKVSSSALTDYLSSFYKEDYYVADTSQMLALRDTEEEHGIPSNHFNFNGYSQYTKRVKVIKPAVDGVMSSQVFDLLFSEKIAVLLQSHSHLLYWEYSRACAQHRNLDTFTRDLKIPLPTARTFAAFPHDCRMTISSALHWAQRATGITDTEATLQLKRTILLSGGGALTTEYHLTFNVFLIFAVHCFTTQALLCAPMQSHSPEDIFEACIQEFLHRSASILASVQQSLHLDVKILDSMFRWDECSARVFGTSTRLSAGERLIIVRHSILAFDALQVEDPYPCLPARPPAHLWDATRFLQYCCHYGLVERVGSLSVPIRAFKGYLTAVSPLSSAPSRECVLAPQSTRCSSSLVLSLLEDLAKDAYGGAADRCDLVLELLPTMIAYLDLDAHETASLSEGQGSCPVQSTLQMAWFKDCSSTAEMEDIVRYGGDKAMKAFSQCKQQLHEVYGALVVASSHVLKNNLPPSQGIFQLPVCGDMVVEHEENGSSGETLLSVVCAYLSCNGLLQASKIAKIAKQSLHTRLRPVVTSAVRRQQPSNATHALYAAADGPSGESESQSRKRANCDSHDTVTVSMAEFEEAFIRCAFACWEASGALLPSESSAAASSSSSFSSSSPSNPYSSSEPDPVTLLEACAVGTVDWDSRDPECLRDTAYHYCIEGLRIPSKDRGDQGSWGVDFIGSYARTLFALSEVPLPHSLAVIDLEAIAVADKAAAAEKEREAKRLSMLQEDALEEEKKKKLEEERRLAHLDDEDRKYLDSHMGKRTAVSALSTGEKPLQVSEMQALMDKSKYLGNASVGINLLLGGSKEELWPVYATFCSCGDSTNPGKISGPNLFTLLSKLGLLNNRIALSDVGMLLHQISAHLHAQAPVSMGAFSSVSQDSTDCPSLSFEEFLVFLCAYSQQFYESSSYTGSDCGDTETLSTLSPDPVSLRREAIRLMAVGSKTSPSVSVKPTRHRGSSTTSDPETCSIPLYSKDISISDSRPYVPLSSQGNQQQQRGYGGSTGLNIIISSDSGVEGGLPSASRTWFAGWREHMNSSVAFKDLLESNISPMLRGHTILATPDDARLRDKYSVLYSLEVLLAMQRVEDTLRSVFIGELQCDSVDSPDSVRSGRSEDSGLGTGTLNSKIIINALRRINMVPQVISENEILRLIRDIVPEMDKTTNCSTKPLPSPCPPSPSHNPFGDSRSPRKGSPTKLCEGDKCYNGELLFAHLEWVVCMVAFEAMDSAVRLSSTPTDPEDVPSLVAELVEWIVNALDRAPTPATATATSTSSMSVSCRP